MNFKRLFFGGESKVSERKDGPIFYHYTSRRAAENISLDGCIRKSADDGVLLTTMAPELHFRDEILYNNYGANTPAHLRNRADYCVRVLPTKLIEKKLSKKRFCTGRLIYLYDDDIRVHELDVFDKPTCNRGSQTHQSDVQQLHSSPSSSLTPAQKPMSCDVSNADAESDAALENSSQTKSIKKNEIKMNLRRDIKWSQWYSKEHQDGNVTIFAFEWIKEGLKCIRRSLEEDLFVNVADLIKHHIPSGRFSLKDLQIVARNESSNTNGLINFGDYSGISKEVVYSLKDLNRQTVIIGKDRTANYGGYPQHVNERVPQTAPVYVCDLIGLQFQQPYNTGRLVLVGEHLPKGLLDDFIYEQVVRDKKPTMDKVRSDHSGRFIECGDVFFDIKAYVKFVANDVVLAGIALNQCASEALNFKFLKYGTGFFAGPFLHLLDRFIGHGVAEGLENLLEILPETHWITGIELPFFDPCPAIDTVCSKHNIGLKYGKDDALKSTRLGCVTATTNCADPHSMTGNKMDFGSVDGAIAENLSGKAIKFSPIINGFMKERFVKN